MGHCFTDNAILQQQKTICWTFHTLYNYNAVLENLNACVSICQILIKNKKSISCPENVLNHMNVPVMCRIKK